MPLQIDLNADLGELPGPAGRASDAAILEAVTSCAIACGGHAGDADSMKVTLKEAMRCGVHAGAHPAYPDREGFGRRSLDISHEDLRVSLCVQMQTLKTIAEELDIALTHVKPHGALYNDAAKSTNIASSVVLAIKAVFGSGFAIVAPPNSEAEAAALAEGLTVHREGFMDRAYLPDGSLMPRSEPGAVLEDTEARLKQARQIALHHTVEDTSGGILELPVDTLCLHGDSPGAAETARIIRDALEADGVEVKAAGLA